eukprot:353010_1
MALQFPRLSNSQIHRARLQYQTRLFQIRCGSRGAAMCEHFLYGQPISPGESPTSSSYASSSSSVDYAVIMLSRRGCVAPFARRFRCGLARSSADLGMMDRIRVMDDGRFELSVEGEAAQNKCSIAVQQYQDARSSDRILEVPFETISEYLFSLRALCEACQASGLGSRVLMVLAAAVADFYVPTDQMATHKIQSSTGALQLSLPQTPKALGVARREWCPQAVMVSFKLETDRNILLSKARGAIEKYSVHAVVANELSSRYKEVQLVTTDAVDRIEKPENNEIEIELVRKLKHLHHQFIVNDSKRTDEC